MYCTVNLGGVSNSIHLEVMDLARAKSVQYTREFLNLDITFSVCP